VPGSLLLSLGLLAPNSLLDCDAVCIEGIVVDLSALTLSWLLLRPHARALDSNMVPKDGEQARWFATEVQPHQAALRAYLIARYPWLPDIEDLVQDSLVRVLRAHERGAVTSPRGLLFATARNLALDLMRRRQVIAFEPITEIRDSSVFTDTSDVVETLSKKQEFDLLAEAIQSLPDRCRQVFTLRSAYGLSQKEIAETLGITENTVEKQLSNGIRRCAEFFSRHGLP
jgi:RNA polymerase sigma factor (sigma-70 family)